MDRRFLKEITEGYITNHNVFSEFDHKQVDVIRENIYTDLCSVCDELRLEDQPFYDKLYFSNKLYQNHVFENYLNLRYQKTENLENDEILDEGIIATVSGIFAKILASIAGLPVIIQAFTYGILLILILKNNGILSKHMFRFLSFIGKNLVKFGDVVSNAGRNYQLRYAVIQKNYSQCYKRAGIDNLDKINVVNYFNKYSGSNKVKLGVINQDTANILINCYIEVNIEVIQLSMKMFLNCIRNTKNYSKLNNLSSAEFMNYVQSNEFKKLEFNVNTTCFEYYEIVREQLGCFDDILDFFYDSESMKRQMTQKLIGEIDKIRTSMSKHTTQTHKDFRKFSDHKK